MVETLVVPPAWGPRGAAGGEPGPPGVGGRYGAPTYRGPGAPPPGDEHPPGWVGGHGFWVEGVSTNAQGEEVLVCRNPWGAEAETMELTREQYEQWTSSAEIHHD